MKPRLILIVLLFNIFWLQTHTQWTLCPGSSSITGLGVNPVISLANEHIIAVAGGTSNSPNVFLTTNGGNNFVNITGNLTGPELFAVNVRSSNMIFVGDGGSNGGAGGNAKVWKTTNMGVNWNVVLTTGGTAGFINGIRFSQTSNTGIIVSDGPTASGILVYKTTDGGNNWTSQNVSAGYNTASLGSMFVINDQIYGFGASSINRVTYTTNGGTAWNFENIPLSGTGVLVDCNSNQCIAVTPGSLPNIYRFQFGSSGTVINTGTTPTGASAVRFPGNGTYGTVYICALVGTNPVIRSFFDWGQIWTQMTTAGVGSLTCMDSKFAGIYWDAAVSTSGQVIRHTQVISGIIKTNELTPSEYSLEQNYPNPFNPATNINYSIPKKGFVTLKVYNALGELVSTLVDEEQNAGNYSVDLDAGELSSGIYYYTISSGNFRETKKMVLIK